MPGDVIQKVVKGLVRTAVRDNSNPLAPVTLLLPTASQITYDTGIELADLEGVSCQGVKITRSRYPTSEKPKVNLTFPNTPETIALKLNRKFVTRTAVSSSIFQSDFIVPPDGIVAAKPIGTLGNGVAADAVSKAWQLNAAGITDQTALTQGTFAGFDAATTPLGFAIGADNAQKWGSGLWNSTVSFEIPTVIASLSSLGTIPYSALNLRLAFVTIDGKSLLTISFGQVSVDSTGSINFGEGQTEVGFFAGSPEIDLIPLSNFC
ncbi:hypothetical protein H6F86_20585 [Phormidium sp. FACHB-592]|uniref:Uncharacterized protein n=1 Tax=Stenomitos frigidus AS-A4 TaxID=2933935 RepID=A0ABV0KEK5_9CYAN|nr:hypothetical protein [Phormidium sp. FACHB-592]MBD2076230.1 hypothetical protein [Phormidium sp. FACHB-592]